MISIAGPPYDTLEEVIGKRDGMTKGSGVGSALTDFGIGYRCVPLRQDHTMDIDAILASLRPNTRVCHIQRSCG
jgi:cystathionine beta-lyase family protein involved in aluminum resistance